MVKILWDALLEEDLERVRLGRFSEADERLMQQLVRGRGRLFGSFGRGKYAVDFRAPGVFSTRPSTADGGQAFTFSHGWVRKRTAREVPKGRLYLLALQGAGRALRAAGARFDNGVRVAGTSGGWWVAPGRRAPAGTVFAPEHVVAPRRRGQLPGTAAGKQRYIERDGALDEDAAGPISVGSIAAAVEDREAFWRLAEARERSDGRVQGQVIAELPYEDAVGPEGRRRIAEAFGRVFDRLGLRWHAAVHKPDSHSDARNFHLHFLYYDRPADRRADGTWRLAATKSAAVRRWTFIKDVRRRYAGIVNGELERAGLYRRYDPRTYEEMGIPKEPGVHLGSAAAAMERRGVVTTKGRINYEREWFFRLRSYAEASAVETLGDRDVLLAPRPLLEAADRQLVPEVARAAAELLRRAEGFVDAAEGFQKARAAAEVTRWRGDDLAIRPAAAAENHEDSQVRREALEVATAVRGWALDSRRAARQLSERAAARRREARRKLRDGSRVLEGELLLGERRLRLAERERARERLDDGRLSERQWRLEGDGLAEAEAASRRRVKDLGRRLASGLREAYGKEAAPLKEAARDRRRRPALSQRLRRERHAGLAKDLARLTEAENRLAEIEARRRRRRRDEADPKRFKRRVRPAVEEAALVAAIDAAERAIDDADSRILAHGTAYRLAVKRGVAARLGRDGAEARAKREAARGSGREEGRER